VAWTVLMNSIRLLVIALAWAWYQVDLIEGWPHTVLGLVIFSISAVVIFSVDGFLLALFAPINVPNEPIESRRRSVGRALVYGWNSLVAAMPAEDVEEGFEGREIATSTAAWGTDASVDGVTAQRASLGFPTAGAFAALGLAYLVFFLPSEVSQKGNIRRALLTALELNEASPLVPDGDWELLSFSQDRREIFRWDNWGQYSRTYNLRDADGFTYQLSCDFMFGPHWHDLRVCYRGAGWRIVDEKVLEYEKLADGPQSPVEVESSLTAPPVVEQFTIQRVPDVMDGLITYGAFRANGQWFNRPRGRGLWQDLVAHIVQGRDRAEQADYFQIQVTTYFEGEINPVQKQRAEWLLHHGTEWFRNYLTAKERS
jgi:hypothetical protein